MKNTKKLSQLIEKQSLEAVREVESIRAEIFRLRREIEWLQNAPMPLADALTEIDVWFNSKISGCNPLDKIQCFFHSNGYRSELFRVFSQVQSVTVGGIGTPAESRIVGSATDLSELLLFVCGDTIRERFKALATEAAKHQEFGPPLAERPALKRQFEAQILELEREEEALIDELEKAGNFSIVRRADVDPKIVLEIENEV